MVLIMITGNYNFFNTLIAVQCASIIVGSDEYKFCKLSISKVFFTEVLESSCKTLELHNYSIILYSNVFQQQEVFVDSMRGLCLS